MLYRRSTTRSGSSAILHRRERKISTALEAIAQKNINAANLESIQLLAAGVA
jgi:hypothetical protein